MKHYRTSTHALSERNPISAQSKYLAFLLVALIAVFALTLPALSLADTHADDQTKQLETDEEPAGANGEQATNPDNGKPGDGAESNEPATDGSGDRKADGENSPNASGSDDPRPAGEGESGKDAADGEEGEGDEAQDEDGDEDGELSAQAVDAGHVTTAEELQQAIDEAAGDVTIDIAEEFAIESTIVVPAGKNVTITSSGGKTIWLGLGLGSPSCSR